MCPQHAAALVEKYNCPLDSLYMLCRHSPDELQQLVDVAVERIEGAGEAVVAAHARRAKLQAERVHAFPIGPLYPTNELGECLSADVVDVAEAVVQNGKKKGTKKGGKGRNGKIKGGNKWSEPHISSGGPPPLPGQKNRRGRPSKVELERRAAAWTALGPEIAAVPVKAVPAAGPNAAQVPETVPMHQEENKPLVDADHVALSASPLQGEVKPETMTNFVAPTLTNTSFLLPILKLEGDAAAQVSPFSKSAPVLDAQVVGMRNTSGTAIINGIISEQAPMVLDEAQPQQQQQLLSASQVLSPAGLSSLLPPEPASQNFALQIAELAAAQHLGSPQNKTESLDALALTLASSQEGKTGDDASPLELGPARSLETELQLMGQISAVGLDPGELTEAMDVDIAIVNDPVPSDSAVQDVHVVVPCAAQAVAGAEQQQPGFDVGSLLA